ncbi:PIR Superfamily Protein [Plasmodium ovale wallikeri]|uniref:PIR Superfamily Protein n=1 Tax=Plasmodium ovale wallikeri TaxID=864142 RepID=A0A1A9AP91_PLAOA|nr:PIR Superfamily Protein [Plasmodium ovale wallikeri]
MDDDSSTCDYYDAKYDFLDDLDKYLQYGEKAESYENSDNYGDICTFTESTFIDNHMDINKICKKFKYLVDLLLIGKVESTVNNNINLQYLCYWLNDQLKKIHNNSVCAKVFHQEMKMKDREYKELNISNDNIYDIKIIEWKNINKLINFYNKYNEIYRIISTEQVNENTCIKLSEKCFLGYKNIDENCPNTNKNFCEAFNSFKSKYKKLNFCTESLNGWEKIEFRTLSNSYQILTNDCEISLYRKNSEQPEEARKSLDTVTYTPSMNKQNIVIPVVSVFGISFIGFVLYKFTSFGSLLLPRVNMEKKIWNHLTEEEDTLLYSSQHPLEESESQSYNMSYSSVEAT